MLKNMQKESFLHFTILFKEGVENWEDKLKELKDVAKEYLGSKFTIAAVEEKSEKAKAGLTDTVRNSLENGKLYLYDLFGKSYSLNEEATTDNVKSWL